MDKSQGMGASALQTGLSPTAEPVPVSSAVAASIPCAVLPGDIVQITDPNHHWYPSLIVVSELKSFGVMGFTFMPSNDGSGSGEAYIRLRASDYEPVGGTVLVASQSLFDDRQAAIAIEARSDATGTGAAEGESAAIAQGAPQ